VVAALVLLHFLLHLGLGLSGEAPDLSTVALLVAVRAVRTGTGAALGFVLGLLEDAFSVLSFGANALAMTVVGAVGARTRDLFVGDSLLFLASYLFIGKWIRDLLHWIVVGEGLREPFVQVMLVEGTVAAAYATVAGLVALTLTGVWWETAR
jgi:rod shape-determining protein MreD